MNKYILRMHKKNMDIAKTFGCTKQTDDGKWVYYGNDLPASLIELLYRYQCDTHIENICNMCGQIFNEENKIFRQAEKNKAFFATIVGGKVVQECCEICAEEVREDTRMTD